MRNTPNGAAAGTGAKVRGPDRSEDSMPRPPIEPAPDRADPPHPCEAPCLPEPQPRPAPADPEFVQAPPDTDTPDCCPPETPASDE